MGCVQTSTNSPSERPPCVDCGKLLLACTGSQSVCIEQHLIYMYIEYVCVRIRLYVHTKKMLFQRTTVYSLCTSIVVNSKTTFCCLNVGRLTDKPVSHNDISIHPLVLQRLSFLHSLAKTTCIDLLQCISVPQIHLCDTIASGELRSCKHVHVKFRRARWVTCQCSLKTG